MTDETNYRLVDALNEEWDSPGVRFPNNLCQWSTKEKVDRKEYGYRSALTGLWFRKGRLVQQRKRRCKFV